MSVKNLKGRVFAPDVIKGDSAYQVAVKHGFAGTEEEWLDSIAYDATKKAEGFRDQAQGYRNEAEGYRNDAEGYKTDANTYKNAAFSYSKEAESYAVIAEKYFNDTSTIKEGVLMLAEELLGAQEAASESADEAKKAENNAKNAESGAQTAMNDAESAKKVAVDASSKATDEANRAESAAQKAAEDAVKSIMDGDAVQGVVDQAAEAATQAVEAEAAMIIGGLGVVQTQGNSEKAVMSQKATTDALDAITEGELSKADLWEIGNIVASNGAFGASSVRIRTTKYIPHSVAVIYSDYPFVFSVYAYGEDDAYVGVWDGAGFSKTEKTLEAFDFSTVAEYGYKYKIKAWHSSNKASTETDYTNIHLLNGIYYELKNNSDFINVIGTVSNEIKNELRELADVRRIESEKAGAVSISHNFVAGKKYKFTNNSASYINARTQDKSGTDVDVLPTVGNGKSVVFTATKDAVTLRLYFGTAGSADLEDLSLRVPVAEEKLDNVADKVGQFFKQRDFSVLKWTVGGISLVNGKNDDTLSNRIRTGFIPVSGVDCTVSLDGSGLYCVMEYASNSDKSNLISRKGAQTDWISGTYTVEKDECKYIRIAAKKDDGSDFNEESMSELGGRFKITKGLIPCRSSGRYVSPSKEEYQYDGSLDEYSYDNKLATIYAKWDELADIYPNIITKTVLGSVGGKEIRSYTITPLPARSFDHTNYNIPANSCEPLKILYVSCVHGSEGTIALDDFALFKNLVVHHKPSVLWNNCIFEIIPIANPIGYDTNDRLNGNGININRNFPDGWVYVNETEDPYNASGNEPCSEYETRLLMDFVKSHPDAFLVLNRHGTDPWKPDGLAGYAASKYQSDIETIISSNAATDTMLRDLYPLLNERNPINRAYSVCHSNQFNGTFDRWFNSVGYHGYLLEYTDVISDDKYTKNETVRRMNITAIANLLCDSVINNRGILDNSNIMESHYE